MEWKRDDGGRAAAGFRGDAGDCVVRALAIGTGRPYREVYDELAERNAALKPKRNAKPRPRSARNGTPRRVYEPWLFEHGWLWCPTMAIGSGCTVHLVAHELPAEGPIICRLSRHLAAVVDGVIRDTHNPSRDGTRCVYGYFEPGAHRYLDSRQPRARQATRGCLRPRPGGSDEQRHNDGEQDEEPEERGHPKAQPDRQQDDQDGKDDTGRARSPLTAESLPHGVGSPPPSAGAGSPPPSAGGAGFDGSGSIA